MEKKRFMEDYIDEEDWKSSQYFQENRFARKPSVCFYAGTCFCAFLTVIFAITYMWMLSHYLEDRSAHDKIYNVMSTTPHTIIKTERSNGMLAHNEFTGYPNDENNRAWERLIEPLIFNATKEELDRSGAPIEDSVRVAAGGYMASLGVYHELHCLRRMRLWLYREVYYPNATREDELFMQVHLGHCIEALRVSVMCTADLGLYSFVWSDADATKPTARSNSPRKCKVWPEVDDWSRKRMIPNTQIGLLKDDSVLHAKQT